mmetsp:Transcript_17042/g.43694  ORF Transcript_17042/g.43694 Transcript_17042/m.43694 type:complete len:257 (+) Transcript_17042:673-1443(+)
MCMVPRPRRIGSATWKSVWTVSCAFGKDVGPIHNGGHLSFVWRHSWCTAWVALSASPIHSVPSTSSTVPASWRDSRSGSAPCARGARASCMTTPPALGAAPAARTPPPLAHHLQAARPAASPANCGSSRPRCPCAGMCQPWGPPWPTRTPPGPPTCAPRARKWSRGSAQARRTAPARAAPPAPPASHACSRATRRRPAGCPGTPPAHRARPRRAWPRGRAPAGSPPPQTRPRRQRRPAGQTSPARRSPRAPSPAPR